MQRCPIEGCGRQFENQLTMIEHVKRRHPIQAEKVKQKTTNDIFQRQAKMTEEMNKLPKMNRIIQMSKQKKPLQFQRRSISKKTKQILNIIENNQSKVADIITESRQIVEENSNTKKLIKRVSSSKEMQQGQKLPSLHPMKGKKLKLQALKQSFDKSMTVQAPKQKLLKKSSLLQAQNQSQMYQTAPNFAKKPLSSKIQSIRSRSKVKDKQSESGQNKSSKKLINLTSQIKNESFEKLKPNDSQINIQSEKVLQDKPKLQRPIKKLLERSVKKVNEQRKQIIEQPLSQSVFIQKSEKVIIEKESKKFAFPSRPSLTGNSKFTKKQLHQNVLNSEINKQNWKQRTVTLRNKNLEHFQIPNDCQVQDLFLINCQIKSINLNECYSLISLTLNNNKISNLSFLEQTVYGGYENMEYLYLDHNQIENLHDLPLYLKIKKMSFAFNKISGLSNLLKVLIRITTLQELDFSFNPIRKEQNYKEAILSVCKNLKKLDGIVITKFDRQLANEYQKFYYQTKKVIPLSSPSRSDDKYRPSTAVSTNYQLDLQSEVSYLSLNISQKELDREIEILQKMIKNTKQQFEIIREQNLTLEQQILTYEKSINSKRENEEIDNTKLYKKLCNQVEQLELLNFLQFASEKQLEQLLVKKVKQNGFGIQLLSAS